MRFLWSFGGRRKGGLFACKVGLSVSICRGQSSIVAVAFSEVHGLRRALFIIWWLCQGCQACSRGTRHCRKMKWSFCTLREEFHGGPVESAPAWRDWALVASPEAPGELPWLHPLLLSKGWRVRPALTALRLPFWVPPECIGNKFYPGSASGTFEEVSPPIF